MSIEPYNRAERILSGEDLEPTTRLEYFMKEAASGGGGGGGAEKVVFNILDGEEEGELIFADSKTFNDVDEAYQAGKNIEWQYLGRPASFVNWSIDEFGGLLGCEIYTVYAMLSGTPSVLDSIDFECIMMDSTGKLSYHGMTVTGTPF